MGNLIDKKTMRYQPFKVKNFQKYPICTMTYKNFEEAMGYARGRKLKDDEIYVEESEYIE